MKLKLFIVISFISILAVVCIIKGQDVSPGRTAPTTVSLSVSNLSLNADGHDSTNIAIAFTNRQQTVGTIVTNISNTGTNINAGITNLATKLDTAITKLDLMLAKIATNATGSTDLLPMYVKPHTGTNYILDADGDLIGPSNPLTVGGSVTGVVQQINSPTNILNTYPTNTSSNPLNISGIISLKDKTNDIYLAIQPDGSLKISGVTLDLGTNTLNFSWAGTNGIVHHSSSGVELDTDANPTIVKPQPGTNTIVFKDSFGTNVFGVDVATTANSLIQATNLNFAGIITNALISNNGGTFELRSLHLMSATNWTLQAWLFGKWPGGMGVEFTNGLPINVSSMASESLQNMYGPIPLTVTNIGRLLTTGTGNMYVHTWDGSKLVKNMENTKNVYVLFQYTSSGQTNFPGNGLNGTNIIVTISGYDDSKP